jgi:anthranilate/para-aminobenzoate synthase component I
MTIAVEEVRADQGQLGNERHEHCHTVDIHVNNRKVVLQPGKYDVPTFKKVSDVPQADDLEELVDCKLKPVPESATIPILGCEVFISHVRDGGAS